MSDLILKTEILTSAQNDDDSRPTYRLFLQSSLQLTNYTMMMMHGNQPELVAHDMVIELTIDGLTGRRRTHNIIPIVQILCSMHPGLDVEVILKVKFKLYLLNFKLMFNVENIIRSLKFKLNC